MSLYDDTVDVEVNADVNFGNKQPSKAKAVNATLRPRILLKTSGSAGANPNPNPNPNPYPAEGNISSSSGSSSNSNSYGDSNISSSNGISVDPYNSFQSKNQHPLTSSGAPEKETETSHGYDNDNSYDNSYDNNNYDSYDAPATFDSSDPYNPLKPNDYLQFCQERLEKKRLMELKEESSRRLAELARERELKEQQRKELLEQGDLVKVQTLMGGTSGTGMGRGRGRGLSNLPSWMTSAAGSQLAGSLPNSGDHGSLESGLGDSKRAKTFDGRNYDEDSSSSVVSASSSRRRAAAFSSPSCVLVLRNMVVRGEVDEYLEADTISECSKFGPVRGCKVFEDKDVNCPLEDSVCVFVEFFNQESSAKAYKDLNGRFFGGKQVVATFYDESKYEQNILR